MDIPYGLISNDTKDQGDERARHGESSEQHSPLRASNHPGGPAPPRDADNRTQREVYMVSRAGIMPNGQARGTRADWPLIAESDSRTTGPRALPPGAPTGRARQRTIAAGGARPPYT